MSTSLALVTRSSTALALHASRATAMPAARPAPTRPAPAAAAPYTPNGYAVAGYYGFVRDIEYGENKLTGRQQSLGDKSGWLVDTRA